MATDGHGLYAIEALCRLKNRSTLPQGMVRRWEKTGYVAKIDLAMINRMLQSFAHTPQPVPWRLAVNVSAKTIECAGDEYFNALLRLAPYTRRLIVEITETYCPDDQRVVADFAKRVNDAGMYIALDDCSPENIHWDRNFVKVVAPRFLKLDGGFLNSCFQSEDAAPIQALLDLGRRVNAHIVAEGIDSRHKREFVADIGVGLLQGWLFSKPVPLPSITPLSACQV